MRCSLVARTHFALGLWRVESVVVYKRCFSLICWMMPVKSNELVRPILTDFFLAACRKLEKGEKLIPGWIAEACFHLSKFGLVAECLSWVESLSGKEVWKREVEMREKRVWKKKLKEKVGKRESSWQVSDSEEKKRELAPRVVRKIEIEWLRKKKKSDEVLKICRGDRGYLGGLVLVNRLNLPGTTEAGTCLICRKRQSDDMFHLLVECNGREKCKVDKKIVREAAMARTSKRYPLDLTDDECEVMKVMASKMWRMREKMRLGGQKKET